METRSFLAIFTCDRFHTCKVTTRLVRIQEQPQSFSLRRIIRQRHHEIETDSIVRSFSRVRFPIAHEQRDTNISAQTLQKIMALTSSNAHELCVIRKHQKCSPQSDTRICVDANLKNLTKHFTAVLALMVTLAVIQGCTKRISVLLYPYLAAACAGCTRGDGARWCSIRSSTLRGRCSPTKANVVRCTVTGRPRLLGVVRSCALLLYDGPRQLRTRQRLRCQCCAYRVERGTNRSTARGQPTECVARDTGTPPSAAARRGQHVESGTGSVFFFFFLKEGIWGQLHAEREPKQPHP